MDYCARFTLGALLGMAALSSCNGGSGAPSSNSKSAANKASKTASASSQDVALPGSASGAENGPVKSPKPAFEASISKLIPSDAVVRMSETGDLNGDGREDGLVVIESRSKAEADPRTLAVFLGAGDGRFEKVVENPNAILCKSCGGTVGDPLARIAIDPEGFVLTFEGGSRELWSRTYRFVYFAADRNWYLKDTEIKVVDRLGEEGEQSKVLQAEPKSVSIKDFDADLMVE